MALDPMSTMESRDRLVGRSDNHASSHWLLNAGRHCCRPTSASITTTVVVHGQKVESGTALVLGSTDTAACLKIYIYLQCTITMYHIYIYIYIYGTSLLYTANIYIFLNRPQYQLSPKQVLYQTLLSARALQLLLL